MNLSNHVLTPLFLGALVKGAGIEGVRQGGREKNTVKVSRIRI